MVGFFQPRGRASAGVTVPIFRKSQISAPSLGAATRLGRDVRVAGGGGLNKMDESCWVHVGVPPAVLRCPESCFRAGSVKGGAGRGENPPAL